jgi:hypothetical protein
VRHIFKKDERLLIRSMGKSLQITAIFTDTDEANVHIANNNNNDAVIAFFDPFIFLADKYDKGV